jgi:hypothetical protein
VTSGVASEKQYACDPVPPSAQARASYVMGQLGHEKAEFTLSVYARQMQRRDGETERLRALVEGTLRLEDLDRGGENGQGEGNNGLELDVSQLEQGAA